MTQSRLHRGSEHSRCVGSDFGSCLVLVPDGSRDREFVSRRTSQRIHVEPAGVAPPLTGLSPFIYRRLRTPWEGF